MRFTKALIAVFLFVLTGARAQVYDDDAALWINAVLEKDINKHLIGQLSLQNRINNNVSQYGQGTIDLGLTYKISKLLRVSGNYRFRERRNTDGSYSARHQVYTALYLRKKFKRLLFVYRTRVQAQVKDVKSSYDGRVPVFYWRNKLTARYEISKRLDAYVAEELYSPFYRMSSAGFDRSRSFIGTVYKLNSKMSVETYFLFQRDLYREAQLRRDFIYGITFQYKL